MIVCHIAKDEIAKYQVLKSYNDSTETFNLNRKILLFGHSPKEFSTREMHCASLICPFKISDNHFLKPNLASTTSDHWAKTPSDDRSGKGF